MGKCITAATLLLLLAGGAAGGEEVEDARWAEIRREAFERLHELAGWCRRAELYACRAEVYEAVLALDPAVEVARRWLL